MVSPLPGVVSAVGRLDFLWKASMKEHIEIQQMMRRPVPTATDTVRKLQVGSERRVTERRREERDWEIEREEGERRERERAVEKGSESERVRESERERREWRARGRE